jgi:hypothetical protein
MAKAPANGHLWRAGPDPRRHSRFNLMIKRFAIALVLVVLVCGGLIGFNLFRSKMIADFFANQQAPAVTVSAAWTWRSRLPAESSRSIFKRTTGFRRASCSHRSTMRWSVPT